MATILMLIASSFLLVLSNIFVSKAVKRDYDMVYLCLAGISGLVSMVVPVTWYIWH
jgi:drug/metabolite transporter (DMT)-like permease